jgi:anti-sigma factor RsiW
MSSTHPFEQEEVMAYLDGEISADRAAEIAQHMQQCIECQALAATFRNLSQQFAAWEIESSPARLTEQMTKQLAAAAPPQSSAKLSIADMTPLQRVIEFVRSSRARPWAWAGAGALAMAAFIALTLPVLYTKSHSSETAATRELPLTGRSVTALRAVVPQPASVDGSVAKYQDEVKDLQALQRRVEEARLSSSLEESASSASPSPGALPPAGTPSAPLIARTASLSLVVKDFASVESAVKSVTARHSGYIGELNTSTPPDAAKTFSATLRIPSAQLDAALAELKQLGRVDQETQAGEEITKQYTDLVARLKNSRATEQRLLDVLRNNTGKVKDVLEVENEISRVRGEIEEMEADQRGLQSRVDFATITLSIAEEYKASLQGSPTSTSTRLHNSFVEGYRAVVENVIGLLAWLLEAGPTLILWAAILFFPARWAWKRIRRALTTAPKPAAA